MRYISSALQQADVLGLMLPHILALLHCCSDIRWSWTLVCLGAVDVNQTIAGLLSVGM